jgi:hypothetical protein
VTIQKKLVIGFGLLLMFIGRNPRTSSLLNRVEGTSHGSPAGSHDSTSDGTAD